MWPYDLPVGSESSSEGAFKSFVMLVLWLTALAMFVGGIGAIVSDFADWDLAMKIGGSHIDIPKDRYGGLMMLILAGGLAAVLRFGGVAVDFVRDHKLAFGVLAVGLVAGLVVFGGRIVEWLDGGPAVSAAMNGDTEKLRALFDAGEVEPTDHGQMLCWAAQRGHVDTRLVVFPTFREVSVEKQGEAAVIARQRRLVRQVRRRPEGFGGGFGIAEVILRFAEPVPGVCDRRILVDGTIEASPRPRGVAEAE